MRPTNQTDSTGETQWCHILCALYCPGVRPARNSTSHRVVFAIDNLTNPYRKCEICGRRTQTYVQCQARGCGYTFHPICGLALLALGWRRGTPDQAEVLCRVHRPLPIIKYIHELRNRKWQELLDFSEYWSHTAPQLEGEVCKRPRTWHSHEIEELEGQIQTRLQSASERMCGSCSLTVSLTGKCGVKCSLPPHFNLISPTMLASETVVLPTRSPEECLQFYNDRLMSRMKSELSLAEVPVHLYEEPVKTHKKPMKPARSFVKM